jgi:hypothetical protein
LNIILSHTSKCVTANQLTLNLDKTKIIKFITNNFLQHGLCAGYNGKHIEDSVSTKFLGLQTNNHLNWTNHTDKMIPKSSGACYTVRSVFHIRNTNIIKLVNFAYFHSIIKYGIIFRVIHLTAKRYSLHKNKKKTVRLMASFKPRNSCRSLFKRLEILALPCEYIFSLMSFIANNQ